MHVLCQSAGAACLCLKITSVCACVQDSLADSQDEMKEQLGDVQHDVKGVSDQLAACHASLAHSGMHEQAWCRLLN